MEGDENVRFATKQVLDSGAFGVVFPRVETAEQAERAVRAMRYPPQRGEASPEPAGRRGWGPGRAALYWGLAVADYARRADVWPLDPEGELFAMIMIESVEGVREHRRDCPRPRYRGDLHRAGRPRSVARGGSADPGPASGNGSGDSAGSRGLPGGRRDLWSGRASDRVGEADRGRVPRVARVLRRPIRVTTRCWRRLTGSSGYSPAPWGRYVPNVQRCPSGSHARYSREPKSVSSGGLWIFAPADRARSKCPSTSSTYTQSA